ncbi:hypothetical protein DIT68_03915 [Brumimicrobium oceani]|uniref:Uncharacterized protein n=1 Tax=Brumimicrobium oceani TaxID=2100725 RepID=A0A2U2XF24_9FLAO|nr:hypothetical protein DIT68_03915 [Brumimicrobium oceani]
MVISQRVKEVFHRGTRRKRRQRRVTQRGAEAQRFAESACGTWLFHRGTRRFFTEGHGGKEDKEGLRKGARRCRGSRRAPVALGYFTEGKGGFSQRDTEEKKTKKGYAKGRGGAEVRGERLWHLVISQRVKEVFHRGTWRKRRQRRVTQRGAEVQRFAEGLS